MNSLTEEELRVLAWTVLGEAAGESDAGLQAVAWTLRNRSISSRWPENPAIVALQQNSRTGYFAYSTWNTVEKGGNNPAGTYPVGSPQLQRAERIVNAVFNNRLADNTNGATFYITEDLYQKPGEHPSWWGQEAKHGVLRIGNHRFPQPYARGQAPDRVKEALALEAHVAVAGAFDPLRGGEDANTPGAYAPIEQAAIVSTNIQAIASSPDLQTALDKLAATRRLQLGESVTVDTQRFDSGGSRAGAILRNGQHSTLPRRNQTAAEDAFNLSVGTMFAQPVMTQREVAQNIRTVQTLRVDSQGRIHYPDPALGTPLNLPVPIPGTPIPDPAGPGLVVKDSSRLTPDERRNATGDVAPEDLGGPSDSGLPPRVSGGPEVSGVTVNVDEYGIRDSSPPVLPADLQANLELNNPVIAIPTVDNTIVNVRSHTHAAAEPVANIFSTGNYSYSQNADGTYTNTTTNITRGSTRDHLNIPGPVGTRQYDLATNRWYTIQGPA